MSQFSQVVLEVFLVVLTGSVTLTLSTAAVFCFWMLVRSFGKDFRL